MVVRVVHEMEMEEMRARDAGCVACMGRVDKAVRSSTVPARLDAMIAMLLYWYCGLGTVARACCRRISVVVAVREDDVIPQ